MYLDLAHEKAEKEGRWRRARTVFALVVLLGALDLPLLGLVLADEHAPLCSGRGRCCCSGVTAEPDDRPCLRRGCGCGHTDATPAVEPLAIDAVLPATSRPAVPEPCRLRRTGAGERPLARHRAPAVPPPRNPLPA